MGQTSSNSNMPGLVPRFDSSEPRRPEAIRPFKLDAPSDTMASFASGGGMMLGAAAMFTKSSPLALLAFGISLNSVNGKGMFERDSAMGGSPLTSLMMSATALANVGITRLLNPEYIRPAATSLASSASASATL